MNALIDPAIMGGVFAVVIGSFKMVEKAVERRNGSGNGYPKLHEAEWRGEITQILKQQNKLAERQTVILERHCEDTRELGQLLREVHEQACKD